MPVKLEIELEDWFNKGVRAEQDASQVKREPGFHVSSLSYGCLRNIQYAYMDSMLESSNADNAAEEKMEGRYRMWIGSKLHETPLSLRHEWPVMKRFMVGGRDFWLFGHIDEVYVHADGKQRIIDKKFVAKVPYSANEHHVSQISYYAYLYHEQTGADIAGGALIYFAPHVSDKGLERLKIYSFDIDLVRAKTELESKVVTIATALNEGKIVDRKTSWLCRYCRGLKNCEALSGPVSNSSGGEKK